MLCLPGLTPVANDAHAVGDSGECVVPSGYMPPSFASFEMLAAGRPSSTVSTSCGIHAVEAEDHELRPDSLWRRAGRQAVRKHGGRHGDSQHARILWIIGEPIISAWGTLLLCRFLRARASSASTTASGGSASRCPTRPACWPGPGRRSLVTAVRPPGRRRRSRRGRDARRPRTTASPASCSGIRGGFRARRPTRRRPWRRWPTHFGRESPFPSFFRTSGSPAAKPKACWRDASRTGASARHCSTPRPRPSSCRTTSTADRRAID